MSRYDTRAYLYQSLRFNSINEWMVNFPIIMEKFHQEKGGNIGDLRYSDYPFYNKESRKWVVIVSYYYGPLALLFSDSGKFPNKNTEEEKTRVMQEGKIVVSRAS